MSMIKTILPTSFDFAEGDPLVSLVPVTKAGSVDIFSKSASKNIEILKGMQLSPREKHVVLHLVAMGSMPHYPSNTNGDSFVDRPRRIETPEGSPIDIATGLNTRSKTFETDASVYKEHFNRPQYGDKTYGDVLKALFHPKMHRTELLVELPEDQWARELQDLQTGKDIGFSMSCKIPHDFCSICGEKTPVASKYCDHRKHALGKIWKSGHRVCAINERETFYDISGVRTKADHVAFGLSKAASASFEGMSGLQLAEALGMSESLGQLSTRMKYATQLRKLSAMEKRIELHAPADDPVNQVAAAELDDDTHDLIKMAYAAPEDVLHDLGSHKIVLGLGDFMKVMLRDKYAESQKVVKQANNLVPGVFNRLMENSETVEDGYFHLNTAQGRVLGAATLNKLAKDCSVDTAPVRAQEIILCGHKRASKKQVVGVSEDMKAVDMIAQTYGQYKLACCLMHPEDTDFHRIVVASGYY